MIYTKLWGVTCNASGKNSKILKSNILFLNCTNILIRLEVLYKNDCELISSSYIIQIINDYIFDDLLHFLISMLRHTIF